MSTNLLKRTVQRDSAPLSFGQRSLWFLHQLKPESFAYNTYKSWRIYGRLNEDTLRRAIDTLALRHEPLRSRIELIKGEPRQVADTVQRPAFVYEDIRAETKQTLPRLCRQIVLDEARKPMDIEKGPVFRVTLLRIADDECILVFVNHHAFIDGWSVGVLVRDFSEIFNAYTNDRTQIFPN